MPKFPRILCALLIFGTVFVYTHNLSFPPEPYYDEVHYVNFVRELIDQQWINTGRSAHPMLSHVMDAAFMLGLGDQPWVWRLTSLFSGLMLVGLVFRTTLVLTKQPLAAWLAVFFYVTNGVSLTQARIQMPNALMQVWMWGSLLCVLEHYVHQRWSARKTWLLAGLFLGLALATKLTAVSLVLMYAGIAGALLVARKEEPGTLGKVLPVCLVIVPALVFLSAHVFIPFLSQHTWADIWNIQKINMHYHMKVAPTQTHGYSSPWWGWPLMLRPIWYYYQSVEGVVRGIICIGNPVMFWVNPLVMLYFIWRFARERTWLAGIIVWGYFSQWLFFAGGGRLKFFHYIDTTMPFVAMAFAVICARLIKSGGWRKGAAITFMVAVLAMFIYWYPLLTGYPISHSYYQHHMWFRRWI